MDQRQDAVLAAAKFTVAVNDAARGMPGRQVATVGRVVPSPNTRNVIAGRVELTVDVRDISPSTLDALFVTIERHAAEIAAATNTRFSIRTTQRSEPALADARLMEVIATSASALGLSSQRMPSGAGHDAQSMARIAPMATAHTAQICSSMRRMRFDGTRGREVWHTGTEYRALRRASLSHVTSPGWGNLHRYSLR